MSRTGTATWRRTRDYVLTRDRYLCQRPGPDGRICGAPATACGHIIDHAIGGTDHPDNLRAECTPCNSAAGARTAQLLRRGF